MHLPDTVKILSHTYDLHVDVPGQWSDENVGWMCDKAQEIRINGSMHPEAQLTTLFHEIVHALDAYGEQNMTESQVNYISAGLVSVLRDNPELLIPFLPLDIDDEGVSE